MHSTKTYAVVYLSLSWRKSYFVIIWYLFTYNSNTLSVNFWGICDFVLFIRMIYQLLVTLHCSDYSSQTSIFNILWMLKWWNVYLDIRQALPLYYNVACNHTAKDSSHNVTCIFSYLLPLPTLTPIVLKYVSMFTK